MLGSVSNSPRYGVGTSAPTELMLTTVPFAFLNCGRNALVMLRTPQKLTSNTFLAVSISTSANGMVYMKPALFTRQLSEPLVLAATKASAAAIDSSEVTSRATVWTFGRAESLGSVLEMSRRVAKTRKPCAANEAARDEPTEPFEVPVIKTDRWEDSLARMANFHYLVT